MHRWRAVGRNQDRHRTLRREACLKHHGGGLGLRQRRPVPALSQKGYGARVGVRQSSDAVDFAQRVAAQLTPEADCELAEGDNHTATSCRPAERAR